MGSVSMGRNKGGDDEGDCLYWIDHHDDDDGTNYPPDRSMYWVWLIKERLSDCHKSRHGRNFRLLPAVATLAHRASAWETRWLDSCVCIKRRRSRIIMATLMGGCWMWYIIWPVDAIKRVLSHRSTWCSVNVDCDATTTVWRSYKELCMRH